MSLLRLAATTAAMAATALLLRLLTPDLSWLRAGADLQRVADSGGPETLLLAAVAGLAWLTWAWGALGLVLTASSALPGLAGAVARAGADRLLPAGARRATALLLGVGLATTGPLVAGCGPGSATTPVAAAAVAVAVAVADEGTPGTGAALGGGAAPGAGTSPVPDWPVTTADAPPIPDWPVTTAGAPPVPDWPVGTAPTAPDWPLPAPGEHVVVRGDSLWDIAAADLLRRTGRAPDEAAVAVAVERWWAANAAVIGPDPDLLLPGQVLRPPPP